MATKTNKYCSTKAMKPLRIVDLRNALRGNGWMTISELVALFADRITPECAIRMLKKRNASDSIPIEERIAVGQYRVISMRLSTAIWNERRLPVNNERIEFKPRRQGTLTLHCYRLKSVRKKDLRNNTTAPRSAG